jgi:DHA1 family multidrug resistance protein-like MFS transporter
MNRTEVSSKQTLSTLWSSIFLLSPPFFIMGMLLPIFGKDMGASAVEIGLIFSAFSIMTILMRPIVGWALDRFGRRLFYVVGMLGYAVTMVGFAYSQQISGLIVARLMQGASSACVWLAASAIIADVTDGSNRAHAFGGLAQASSRGSIVGAFITFTLFNTPMQEIFGREVDTKTVLFLLFAVFAVAAFFVSFAKLQETNRHNNGITYSPIVWSRPWILLLLVTLVTAAAWAMTSPILILFLQENLKADLGTIAWAFLPSGIIWAMLPSQLGKLADRFGRKPLMVLGLALSAITMFLLPSLTSAVGLAILWAMLALCFAAGDPAEQALVADLTNNNQRGRAYGLYVMVGDIGTAIGPLSGGWLYDSMSPAAPFYATGIILIICGLILLVFLQTPTIARSTETST